MQKRVRKKVEVTCKDCCKTWLKSTFQLKDRGGRCRSCGNKGRGIGRIFSEETRAKIRAARAKQVFSEETRKKFSEKHKGNKYNVGRKASEEARKNMSIAQTGRTHSLYTRMLLREQRVGEKNCNWKGGVTGVNKAIRRSLQYKLWREAIYKRDNRTCQHCGERGGILNADHIQPFSTHPELRFDENNGRTLCIECHRKTETYGRKLFKYLKHSNGV